MHNTAMYLSRRHLIMLFFLAFLQPGDGSVRRTAPNCNIIALVFTLQQACHG
jgi:hypothetical protein